MFDNNTQVESNSLRYLIYLILVLVFVSFSILYSQQYVKDTKHNLSSGAISNPIRASSENEICIFCHTPHSSPKAPLWNRNDPGNSYTLYNSSTIQATPGQPDGNSVLCLSCHDGTIALGNVSSRSTDIAFINSITTMPAGNTNLSTDLSDDHPISFVYDASLATSDGELKSPSSITSPVHLDVNSKMQCTSCHDPHNDSNSGFLLTTSENSNLCLACHTKSYWSNSTHKTSTATWNSSGNNPWFHTSYTTVAANACENCHNPHNASGSKRLLNYSNEETNCLNCHNGNVASSSKDIQTELNKTYKHNVAGYTGVHNPTEDNVVSTQHVECVDCHNPHASNATTASAPNANGFIKYVKGVNTNGDAVSSISYEYELCYRCHSTSTWRPSSPTNRVISQNNVMLEFDLSNPSYHPIEGAGANNNVPSLISPLTESSVIYCTDCHASNGTGAPAGPHGSIYPSILKYRYETADNTQESPSNYALCYSCHSRTSILNDESFKKHDKHIRGEDTPCNACHDPHGISHTQGNSTNNSNLINFDTDIVSSLMGNLYFRDRGTFSGECFLRCHNKNHRRWKY